MAANTPEVEKYLAEQIVTEHPVLKEMEAEGAERRFPIIGAQCGRFIHTIARMIQARRIFEMGSGFGYSTLWFALALPEDGEIHHTEGDPANSEKARVYFEKAGQSAKVRRHVGDAREAIQQTTGQFDIILIDANKDQYPECFRLAIDRLRTGGVMIVDNAFLNGHVLNPENKNPGPEGIRELTRMMLHDERLITSIVPMRDGLLVGYKVK